MKGKAMTVSSVRSRATNSAFSIIGAGHCGCAFAADLASRGASVMLYAHPDHRRSLESIERKGHLEASIKIEGLFHPLLTSQMKDAIQFSKVLIVTVPAYGHDTIIDELTRFDLSQHVVISITGNFFALAARNKINARAIVETSTSPYASRMQDGKVLVMGVKNVLPVASLPAHLSPELREEIAAVFPMPLNWRSNVLEIGMSCITGVIHPTPTLMNTGWIEATKGDFYFYRQGISPSVGKVIDAIDDERMAILREFGFEAPSVVAIMNSYYGHDYVNFTEFAQKTSEHNITKMTPNTMNDRFIVQDVPFVLVPWYELGLKVGVQSPTIKSIIDLASIVNGRNFMTTGRNLKKLGLDIPSRGEILKTVNASLPALPADLRRAS